MATGNSVVNAILAGTSNLRTREAMLLGSHLESGWNPTAVGDNGTSFGPFQMHIGGALGNLTPAQAEDPPTAVKAMLGAYNAAVNQVSSSLWSSNPEQAAEQAAVLAERPAQSYYASQGTAAVNQAWSATQQALNGVASASGSPTGGTGSTPNAQTTGILGSVFGDLFNGLASSLGLPSVGDLFKRLGLILLGGALILIGIYMLVGKEATKIGVSFAMPEIAGTAGAVAAGARRGTVNRTNVRKTVSQTNSKSAPKPVTARKSSNSTGASEAIESASTA